ncbi:MAG: adenine nucleotide alpha hydrolase [Myxococcales bacterium]|nr:MAG: adenine nucleotide alpha hydrolase [Myxococcales bacterium]
MKSERPKIWLAWSSGKDSAWALHVLRQRNEADVAGLLTTINAAADRAAMHAVRRTLVEAQAAACGLPLVLVPIPDPCSNEEYEARMAEAMETAKAQGVTGVAFGDLFLEDVRAYRERQLGRAAMTAHFPLWGLNTAALAREMQAGGLRAIVTCIDPRILAEGFVGREWDAAFLADLPAGVDPCAERGEFHSFAYAGPMFSRPLDVRKGEIVRRGGFIFADVLPAE